MVLCYVLFFYKTENQTENGEYVAGNLIRKYKKMPHSFEASFLISWTQTDALAVEDASGDAAQTYANLLGVKAGNENSEAVLALVRALQSDRVREFINENYGGAVVPIF